MSLLPRKYMNTKETPPDIFHAAEHNDVEELMAALSTGQTLSDQSSMRLNMTPVHIAAAKHSNDFLAAAQHEESFDPWIRDDNLRVAHDHAMAFNNQEGMRILHARMYAHLEGVDPDIDYTDNEPSEFFPG